MIHKWLATMSLSIFLLTGLSTSSFFLPDFLTHVIEENKHTVSQLNFALAQDNEAALLYAWQQSTQGSENWQRLAKKLANTKGEVAYVLAGFYMSEKQLDKNFSSQSEQAMLWYKQAIRLNYVKASIGLAELYFRQGDVLTAQNLLNKFQVMALSPNQHNELSLAAIILLTKIAISIGNVELVKSLLAKFSSLLQADEMGTSLLHAIEKYQVLLAINKTTGAQDNNTAICPNSIQMLATSLAHLDQAERLVKHFKKQPLNDVVCFTPVRYLPLSILSCSSTKKEAILCDESKLDEVADSITTRYIAMMLPEGGANVHFGMLYFDAQDSVDVVEHEISHLLGFVDEYPLVKGHVKCRASQQKVFSQNITVLKNSYEGERTTIREKVLKQVAWAEQIKKSTPILHPSHLYLSDESLQNNQYWQLGTPAEFEQNFGLFKAETCDNNAVKQQQNFNAYKPLSGRTKLQYDELNFPKEYITLLQANSEQFLMPSFHYNIAFAYYQQNKLKQANHWLEQAARWESDDSRRNNVRQGGF